MKGKRLINQQQINQQPNQRPIPSKLPAKHKLKDVRSLEPKLKPLIMNPHPLPKMQQPISSAADYDFQRRQRATLNYIPIGETPREITQTGQPQFRSQRNSESKQFLMQRENNLIEQPRRENNFIRQSNTQSQQNSVQRIKIFSADQKEKSWSRSENNSAKKRSGIQLTKTLLKRISGMYNDKDFQNKSSYLAKSNKEETTGIMTMTMSGRGVCDEYQLSDFDFVVNNNHTVNSYHNPPSYNQSGNWQTNNQSNNIQRNNDSGNWQKANDSGNWQRINDSGNWQRCVESANRNQSSNWRPGSNSGDWMRKQNCHQRANINQSQQSYEQILKRSKQEGKSYPKRDLSKVKSYDLLNSRPMTESIVVGREPPARQQVRRTGLRDSGCQEERYLIRSKGKTLDQLSVKQSMVVGFDNYYH